LRFSVLAYRDSAACRSQECIRIGRVRHWPMLPVPPSRAGCY
jgi:hypothetical protein